MSYYDSNSKSFFDSTINVDVDLLYSKFTPLICAKGCILDLGCGSGRDSKYFINNGYKVIAIEPSVPLSKLASDYIGQNVIVKNSQELNDVDVYDGIWACASLLHVPMNEMTDVFQRLAVSLKVGGVIYCSFKLGVGEIERNGRAFTDMNQLQFDELLENVTALKVISIWESIDLRKGRQNEKWFNALLRKL